MQVVISPAKRMVPADDSLEALRAPRFAQAAGRLVERLQSLSLDELKTLWKCSDALARAAYGDLLDLDAGRLGDPGFLRSPAVLSYAGIQYQSMAPQVMDEGALAWLDRHLVVASGLFGALRAFDGVAPYRLEMQARLPMPCRVLPDGRLADKPARNLYEFWGEALAGELVRTGTGTHVVNLASVEYADAVVPHLGSEVPVTTCIFLEPRADGAFVQRATASKAARGTMVRWMAEHGIEDPADLASFDLAGYRLDPGRSSESPGRRLLAFVHGA